MRGSGAERGINDVNTGEWCRRGSGHPMSALVWCHVCAVEFEATGHDIRLGRWPPRQNCRGPTTGDPRHIGNVGNVQPSALDLGSIAEGSDTMPSDLEV